MNFPLLVCEHESPHPIAAPNVGFRPRSQFDNPKPRRSRPAAHADQIAAKLSAVFFLPVFIRVDLYTCGEEWEKQEAYRNALHHRGTAAKRRDYVMIKMATNPRRL